MIELLEIIWKKKWTIVVFCGLAIITSVIVSSPKIMPPYFRSASEFYPSNPSASDRSVIFNTQAGEIPIEYFGSSSDVDRILAIAKSSELAGYIIQKFNLVDHYGIDTSKVKQYNYAVYQEFLGNYKAIKTDLSAIEVSVLDQDPNLAANMTNAIVQWIDNRGKQIIKANKQKAFDILKDEVTKKDNEIKNLSAQKSTLSGLELDILIQKVNAKVKELTHLNTLKDQYSATLKDDFSTIYLIEQAWPSERKAKPVRWMIVIGTALAAFIFILLLLILIEQFKKLNRIISK